MFVFLDADTVININTIMEIGYKSVFNGNGELIGSDIVIWFVDGTTKALSVEERNKIFERMEELNAKN